VLLEALEDNEKSVGLLRAALALDSNGRFGGEGKEDLAVFSVTSVDTLERGDGDPLVVIGATNEQTEIFVRGLGTKLGFPPDANVPARWQ
jgi:hypothetical protein